jgi:hypothetical protein
LAGLTQRSDDLRRLRTLIRNRRYQASYWTAVLRDGERPSGGDFVQQPRKMRLGLIGPTVDRFLAIAIGLV